VAVVEQALQSDWQRIVTRAGRVANLARSLTAADRDAGDLRPCWHNGYFGPLDARTAYGVVGLACPQHVIEIGSGYSTRFLRKAIDDFAPSARQVAIDPSPRTPVASIVDEHISLPVTSLEPAFFDRLGRNDILFLDGSHLVVPGSDAVFVLLEVLPRLASGVIVHVHDIYLPDPYPERCERLYYGEQYLLAALLAFGADWEPFVPVHYLTMRGIWPGEGCSFWLRRRTAVESGGQSPSRDPERGTTCR
jgi:hypothetical protein